MRRSFPATLAAVIAATRAAAAHASAAAPCHTGTACDFRGILHILYAIAVILGIVLIAAVIIAIYVYRRNKRAELDL